jgi:hypothetical protein
MAKQHTDWFPRDGSFPSKQVEAEMRAALHAPGAGSPVMRGVFESGLILLGAYAAEIRNRVLEIADNLGCRLAAIEAKADKLERKVAALDPVSFVSRESGKRSMEMELTDGRRAIVTSEVHSGNGDTLIERASRLDKVEATAREIESQLRVTQQQLTAAHKRIAALERAKEQQ